MFVSNRIAHKESEGKVTLLQRICELDEENHWPNKGIHNKRESRERKKIKKHQELQWTYTQNQKMNI